MAVEVQAAPGVQQKAKKQRSASTFGRVGRYTLTRLFTLFVTVVVGVYLTIMIANMGGYVDKIMKAEIRENTTMAFMSNKGYQKMSTDERAKLLEATITQQENRLGLNTPFLIRSFRYLGNALTLNLGQAQNMTADNGSKQVRLIILGRLPATLLLMGSSELFLFFSTLFLALALSRHYGSFWDKFTIALSPTSTVPPWFYGIFLILIFAAVLHILPFGGLTDTPVPTNPFLFILSVLKHLILPGLSLILASFFLSIYNWRTFFLIYSSEDYVEMAKAKGLTSRDIERRYILRPTLPTIITQFALLLIGVWQGAIITETVFLWPGLGRTLFTAIGFYDTPVIVGTTIIYAYLLALTVFVLDFVYALVDPRVKVGE
ncbi:MAG TPA: ABC transporter permease [Anaerolineales bacterium]|nr:ABC transporter permease [Anaerolineales bacterium]